MTLTMPGTMAVISILLYIGLYQNAQSRSVRQVEEDPVTSEWYRCHGLPCSEWEEVEQLMAQLNANISYDLTPSLNIPSSAISDEASDIWLTPDQARQLIMDDLELRRHIRRKRTASEPTLLRHLRTKRWDKMLKDTTRLRVRRKIESFTLRPERKWTLPIIYKFDGNHDNNDKAIIRAALDHWMDQTCLQFFEVNEGAPISASHLKLTNIGYRCASFVGRVDLPRGVPQQINLASSCLTKFGIPVHEIGHALGLWHEQQRSDRDLYITVINKNVDFWARANFSPAPEEYLDNYDMPYDFNSVMHYGPTVGSYVGNTTIATIDPLFQHNIGQRVGLSFIDAKVINMAYCQDECETPLPFECLHGGYQDPNDCGVCRCPDGLTGRTCDTVAPSVGAFCGGSMHLRAGERLEITSPGYGLMLPYEERVECNWLITANENHTVTLQFEDDFDVYCMNQVCYHWLEVRRERDFEKPGPRFCCAGKPRDILVSETNAMLVTFRSNYTLSSGEIRLRGFKAILDTSEQEDMSNIVPQFIDPDYFEPEVTPDGSGEILNPFEPQLDWSEWTRCVNHPCTCGGCSTRSRYRTCNGHRCEGELDEEEEEACSRPCEEEDKMLYYAGRIYTVQCPECCNGYQLQEDGHCGGESPALPG